MKKNINQYTVVPALGDPRHERPPAERPPAVYGHVINVPTHFNVKLRAISGHLPNTDADSHLLVVRTCYITDSTNKCCVFGSHFNPKSLAVRTLSCDRQFTQISMLPSGDRKQYFISRVNSCVMNHLIVASGHLVTFVLRHHVVKVMSCVFIPR